MRRRSSAIALIPILLVVLSCFERAAAQSACTMCQCQAGNVVFCYGVSAVPSDFPIDTTYIFFSVSPLTSVPSNAFDGLNQLTRLTFLQTGLTAIPFNAISSITTLQSLTFSPATYLAADLTGNQFTGFPSLTYLDLKNVEFSNFAANAFNGLSQLTSLSLTMTGTATATATSFPVFSALTYFYLDTPAVGSSASTELFAKMPALSTLYMAQTRVTSLAPNAFAGLSNLTTLALWGTGITSFPDHAFAQLSSLQSLSLHSVPVTTIAASAFSGLTSLTSLTLDVHLLTSLPTNVFQDLTSLRDLDMSRGPYGVGICFTGVFQSLTELSTLHMNWGEPCALHTHAFTGLSALETLNLYGPVDSIADNVFEPLPSLKSLNLIVLPNLTLASNAYSGLQELPTLSLKLTQLNAPIFEMFSALHALTTLDLSASQFSVLPSHAFAALPQLTNLYLGNGAWDPVISSVASDAFSDLLQLEFLSMGGNYETLTTLPPGLFYGLTKLRTADLSGNAFPGPSAPPSTYGSPSNPTPCNASCATCFAAGAESCCSANCLTCTSATNCTACYGGRILQQGVCISPANDSASTSPLPVIVGATIGGIVAVFALLLLLVVLRRRRSHKPGQPQQVHNVVATVGSRNSVFRSSKKAEAEGHGTNAYEAAMAHDSNTHNPLYEALSDHPESFYASTDMYASVSPTYMNAGATAQSTPNQELHYVGPDLATGSTRPELAASTSNYAVIAGTASSDPTYANLH
ncbi:hypothetical protein CAOG_000156 [Capsaspora owczarzaki ATCC 30864]|uniref:Disease resistance R13L4/SHOC-2-like LRR domain-containing protein n=1 Tax=Capsaspora owczarzaki (strain ATCC 30864) TaxID=595528 RepID=A0A0D2WI16_CAPO3|nr:hypothetical protein CAOG_000156 [Capsaspora owczarzaki ATCC 30864]